MSNFNVMVVIIRAASKIYQVIGPLLHSSTHVGSTCTKPNYYNFYANLKEKIRASNSTYKQVSKHLVAPAFT